MPILVLILLGGFLIVGLGLQGVVHHRRTGYNVLRGLYRRPFSKEWWISECWVLGFGAIAVAAVLEQAGRLNVSAELRLLRVVGLVITLLGFAAAEWSVSTMGESWRVDVQEDQETELVTGGPFRFVRNPIYSSMLVVATGLTLMEPVLLSVAGAALVLIGLELQVRVMEEPYLLRSHADAWLGYASRVGRFVPGMGRLVPHGRAQHPTD